MEYSKMFLLNLGMLIAVAYCANVFYKYVLNKASTSVKYASSVLFIILCGWISSAFGFNFNEDVIFDLRFVPLIIAILVYPHASVLVLIGVLTGLVRFTLGFNEASIAGFINMSILGVLGAGLNYWMRHSSYRLIIKASIVIGIVNIANVINIAIFGVIPPAHYFGHIVPYTLPLGILLSYLFALMLRDFQMEQRRNHQITQANRLLSRQRDELQQAKLILEERAKQLMMASKYKSEFMATMSHELRTPLNSIINLAQIINEQGKEMDEEDLKQYSGIIHASGQDLLQLINDILDLSKVEAGKMEIVMEPVNVLELGQVMMVNFEITARNKGLIFQFETSEDCPAQMNSDPQRIQQILRNLLSNAFKFTHEGSVILSIYKRRLVESELQGEWVVFSVKDTGIGISQEKQHYIFEAFQQADGSISRKYGGTGLGLSISRDLARLMGGFIRLDSAEGEGSTFALYLPLYTTESPPLEESGRKPGYRKRRRQLHGS